MKIGASRYHPGLTARWWTYRHDTCSLDSLTPALGAYAMRGTVDGVERRWMLYTVDDNADPVERGEYTRRCDAKRAAEVLVGQWWREKCERESLAAAYNARLLAAFRGENHGTGTVDVVARAIAERVNAARKTCDETMARSDFMRCPDGAGLDRLAALYGVERRESTEETRAAMVDALRCAADA